MAFKTDGELRHLGAQELSDDSLVDEYRMALAWLSDRHTDEMAAKFSIDLARFRELSWELNRRNMLVLQ